MPEESAVSRWSQEFDKHPIHTLLDQADQYLAVEGKDIDDAFQAELERLKRLFVNLREVVAGLDPEFYPKPLLDGLNQHLANNVLNRLQSYANRPSISPLQAANDHFNSQIAAIYHLAALTRPKNANDSVVAARKGLEDYRSLVSMKVVEIDGHLDQRRSELGAIGEKSAALESRLDEMGNSVKTKLAEWQEDYTNNQTARAEEHSKAQIEREKKFADFVREQEERFDKSRDEILTDYNEMLNKDAFDFKGVASKVTEDILEKQESIRKLHGLVTDETITGGYHRSAQEESEAANNWRLASISCLAVTAGWLVFKVNSGFAPLESGQINWPNIISAYSLTAILLYAAGYMSRQSKMHRDNGTLLRSYALETQALDPFIATLDLKEQKAIKAELVKRMFGQQNAAVNGEPQKIDDGSVKAIADKVVDATKDLANTVVKKTSNDGT